MDDPGGSDPSAYTSKILQLFMALLDQKAAACLLDFGPILGANIAFFSQRVTRLFVCDLLGRLNQARRQDRPLEDAWRHLDYPRAHFDGILLWDLLDRLEADPAARLVAAIRQWIRPAGLVVMLSRDLHGHRRPFIAFRVEEGFQLQPKPIPGSEAPVYPRQNREIMALMSAFSSVKSFIYRNGMREHLFRWDKGGMQGA
jgi:hypothetical protein